MTDTLTLDDVITTRVVSGVRWYFVRHPKRPKVRAATVSSRSVARTAGGMAPRERRLQSWGRASSSARMANCTPVGICMLSRAGPSRR
jgi:hypothetical protein